MTNADSALAGDFEPILLHEVELSQPLAPVPATRAGTGHTYRRALVLVRLYTQPLGLVSLALEPGGLSADTCARQIWAALYKEINAERAYNVQPAVGGLDANGITPAAQPRRVAEREQWLRRAPFVSVIIPTHERAGSLEACLRSLLALEYPHYDVIVVDNHPRTSATEALVRRLAGASGKLRYVREDAPGSSVARNRGVTEALGEIVAFTDDDVLVDRHWLTEIVRAFEAGNNVACVTGLTLPAEIETPAQLWFEQYGGFSKGFHQQIFDEAAHRPDDPLFPYTAGKFGSSANMAIRTDVLRWLGGFDPALGAGSPALAGTDIALYYRVITRGYQLVYTPNAIVHHYHRRDYARLKRQIYNYGVGLTAFLTKCILEEPYRAVDLARRIPRGLWYTLSPRSPKNRKKARSYPRELSRLELKGMLYGPIAYVRSRKYMRVLARRHAPHRPAVAIARHKP